MTKRLFQALGKKRTSPWPTLHLTAGEPAACLLFFGICQPFCFSWNDFLEKAWGLILSFELIGIKYTIFIFHYCHNSLSLNCSVLCRQILKIFHLNPELKVHFKRHPFTLSPLNYTLSTCCPKSCPSVSPAWFPKASLGGGYKKKPPELT